MFRTRSRREMYGLSTWGARKRYKVWAIISCINHPKRHLTSLKNKLIAPSLWGVCEIKRADEDSFSVAVQDPVIHYLTADWSPGAQSRAEWKSHRMPRSRSQWLNLINHRCDSLTGWQWQHGYPMSWKDNVFHGASLVRRPSRAIVCLPQGLFGWTDISK